MRICSVRGFDTSMALGGAYPPLGDTALLIPLLYSRLGRSRSDEVLLVWSRTSKIPLLEQTPASQEELGALADQGIEVISPVVDDRHSCEQIVERIANAKFVLAGAMHAAIVALAYGVPFAFFRSGSSQFVDCPAKWQDLCSVHGINPEFFPTNAMQLNGTSQSKQN